MARFKEGEMSEGAWERGHKGGSKTRDTHGKEHFKKIGATGGATTKARRGPEYYAMIGKMGGQTTARKYFHKGDNDERHGPDTESETDSSTQVEE